MKKPAPIFVADLLTEIDAKLLERLKNLSIEDWSLKTIVPNWEVKDITVHLLDGNLRALSMLRDNYFGETPDNINSYEDLLAFLNRLNADWVKAMKRLSPNVIIQLLEQSGKEYCAFIKGLEPFENATFSVAWAGETKSKNWFHIAREYTEKWHHQQQICRAVGLEDELLKYKWYFPYLDTSVRALPYHYRTVEANNNDLIKFTFEGENDKYWFLKWQDNKWDLLTESSGKASCEVIIPDKIAWLIFTKGIKKEIALAQCKILGNQKLGEHIFSMLAVMA